MAVVAAISHKGGAGRSVTLANVAFQLHKFAEDNRDVCIVDLDLASPTMGAILGLKRLAGGESEKGTLRAPRSLYDLLNYERGHAEPLPGPTCLRRLDEEDTRYRGAIKPNPTFALLPGFRSVGDWADQIDDLSYKLERIIRALSDIPFGHILLDVRSGSSDVLDALSRAQERSGIIDLALVHIRWTQQHVEGLSTLLDHPRMAGFGADHIRIVRTAAWDADNLKGNESFAAGVDKELRERLKAIRLGGAPLDVDDRDRFIASIPDNPKLRIEEALIVDPEDPCFEAYRRLAMRVRDFG